MIKRMFYVGLGVTVIAVKKATSLVCSGGRLLTNRGAGALATDENAISANGQEVPVVPTPPSPAAANVSAQSNGKPDDLTAIKGIGPTYAKRLQQAGIKTYNELAKQSPDTLREITRAAGNTADPVQWIAEARSLASFFSLD